MYSCKYAGSLLTYEENTIYRYIHLTQMTLFFNSSGACSFSSSAGSHRLTISIGASGKRRPARRFFFPRHRSTLLARLLLLLLAAAIAAAPSFAAGGVTAGVHCTVQHVAFMPHADTLSSISCPCTADLAAVRGAPYRRTVPVGQGPASVTIYEHRCQCHTKDRIDRLIHKQGIVPDGQRQGTARHGTRCTGASRRVVV
jgi:hypothetical protein